MKSNTLENSTLDINSSVKTLNVLRTEENSAFFDLLKEILAWKSQKNAHVGLITVGNTMILASSHYSDWKKTMQVGIFGSYTRLGFEQNRLYELLSTSDDSLTFNVHDYEFTNSSLDRCVNSDSCNLFSGAPFLVNHIVDYKHCTSDIVAVAKARDAVVKSCENQLIPVQDYEELLSSIDRALGENHPTVLNCTAYSVKHTMEDNLTFTSLELSSYAWVGFRLEIVFPGSVVKKA